MPVSTIDKRIKNREECIKKFSLKYRSGLESDGKPYTIRDHITDIIGLRIVCLYEDEVETIRQLISQHFEVLAITDKISQIEGTENSFGYKGLHLDLRLNSDRIKLAEYSLYREIAFELQIRTVVQDSWSILDHKIKYKKSIPSGLKRRINTLAALFELADREFREVRDATLAEIQKADAEYGEVDSISEAVGTDVGERTEIEPRQFARLNAFRLLKIAKHFFPDFDFEAHKVDGFTLEIIQCEPDISRGKFNYYMRENISKIKMYQFDFESVHPLETLNAYTIIRHCLFAGEPKVFSSMLTNTARETFEKWKSGGLAAIQ